MKCIVVVVCLILKELFTCYHRDQSALRSREEDVTVIVVGAQLKSRLLLYLQNTTVFVLVESFYVVVFIHDTLKAAPCLT